MQHKVQQKYPALPGIFFLELRRVSVMREGSRATAFSRLNSER
jgi:hypothetical protein